MRGWVYVITNEAMPAVVKIGFSMKDPLIRARELESTGVPSKYKVEFEVLVENPREVEGKVHLALKEHCAGKEWFKCSVNYAISKIKSVLDGQKCVEKFNRSYALPAKIEALQAPLCKPQIELKINPAVGWVCLYRNTEFRGFGLGVEGSGHIPDSTKVFLVGFLLDRPGECLSELLENPRIQYLMQSHPADVIVTSEVFVRGVLEVLKQNIGSFAFEKLSFRGDQKYFPYVVKKSDLALKDGQVKRNGISDLLLTIPFLLVWGGYLHIGKYVFGADKLDAIILPSGLAAGCTLLAIFRLVRSS